jgi:II/X family phage/plasmid replication protein
MIDTVCFLTPKIPQLYIDIIQKKLKVYTCVDADSGELIYEFSTGSVSGSYDSSINIKINPDNTLKITCSIHKVLLGYNIAYGSDNLILLANCLKKILQKSFEVKLPDVLLWQLMQIDYTLTFNLHSQDNVENYINSLKNVEYARREVKHYNNAGIQARGATTVVKFYNKQKEFIEHDYKKIKKVAGQEKADELIDLCEGLLRVEISLRSRKIKQIFTKTVFKKNRYKIYKQAINDYGQKSDYVQALYDTLSKNVVTLKDFNIEKIIKIWESEVLKVLKDRNCVLVNKDNLVLDKLKSIYSTRKVSSLYSFWTLLSTRGDEYVKSMYKKQTFYRLRKDLIELGISWKDTNIYIETDHKVINFTPSINSEYLQDLNKPNYEMKEKIYNLLKVI